MVHQLQSSFRDEGYGGGAQGGGGGGGGGERRGMGLT